MDLNRILTFLCVLNKRVDACSFDYIVVHYTHHSVLGLDVTPLYSKDIANVHDQSFSDEEVKYAGLPDAEEPA